MYRLPVRIVGAFLGRDRDGLRLFLICVVVPAPPAFLFSTEFVVPPSSQCCFWHSGPQ